MLESYIRILSLVKARNEKGASAVEYGLLVAAIAAVIVGIVFLLGAVLNDSFTSTCDAVKQAAC